MYFDILILSTLRRGPAHGYEIKKHVSRVIGGTISVNNNVLYPSLRRFEESGAIERVGDTDEPNSGRPPRTVYRLTTAGQDQLRQLLEDADPAVLADDAEFKIRVSMFADVPAVVRRQVISRRRRLVEEQRDHMLEMRALPTVGEASWATRVVDFDLAELEAELSWLDELEALVDFEHPPARGDGQSPARARRTPRTEAAVARN